MVSHVSLGLIAVIRRSCIHELSICIVVLKAQWPMRDGPIYPLAPTSAFCQCQCFTPCCLCPSNDQKISPNEQTAHCPGSLKLGRPRTLLVKYLGLVKDARQISRPDLPLECLHIAHVHQSRCIVCPKRSRAADSIHLYSETDQ